MRGAGEQVIDNEFLSVVVELCGAEAMRALVAAHGGTRIYIPRRPSPRSALCRTLTVDDVRKIIEAFGFGEVEIPSCNHSMRRASIEKLAAEGKTTREIAKLLGIHQRTVFRHLSALGCSAASLVPARREA